jgi:hypothetical protein
MGSNFFYCYSYDNYLSTQIVTNRTFFFDKSVVYIKKRKFKGGATQLYKKYN